MKDFQPKLNQAGQPISITRSLIEKDEEIEKLKFEVKFLKKKRLIDLGMFPKEKPNDTTLD